MVTIQDLEELITNAIVKADRMETAYRFERQANKDVADADKLCDDADGEHERAAAVLKLRQAEREHSKAADEFAFQAGQYTQAFDAAKAAHIEFVQKNATKPVGKTAFQFQMRIDRALEWVNALGQPMSIKTKSLKTFYTNPKKLGWVPNVLSITNTKDEIIELPFVKDAE